MKTTNLSVPHLVSAWIAYATHAEWPGTSQQRVAGPRVCHGVRCPSGLLHGASGPLPPLQQHHHTTSHAGAGCCWQLQCCVCAVARSQRLRQLGWAQASGVEQPGAPQRQSAHSHTNGWYRRLPTQCKRLNVPPAAATVQPFGPLRNALGPQLTQYGAVQYCVWTGLACRCLNRVDPPVGIARRTVHSAQFEASAALAVPPTCTFHQR